MTTTRYQIDELALVVGRDTDEAKIAWHGTSDFADPRRELDPYFEGLVGELSGRSVQLDLRPLEYMNSSSFGSLAGLVRSLAAVGCRVRMTYDRDVPWQRTNFRCFHAIANAIEGLSVESVSADA